MSKAASNNIKVVIGTKGGVGKSTLSYGVLPVVFRSEQVRVIEIDSNNKSSFSGSFLPSENFKTDQSDIVLDKVELSVMKQSKEIFILDIGGGDDTKVFLEQLQNEDFDVDFYLPVNDDYEQFKNIKDTIVLIQKTRPGQKVNLVLNRCHELKANLVKEQFMGIYGSEDFGIESRYEEISTHIKNVYFLPDSPVFGILKGRFQKHLIDGIIWADDLLENISMYKEQWREAGDDVFMSNKKKLRFAKKVKKLQNVILGIFDGIE